MYAHYDASTGDILGFYSTEIHGGNIPEPHIEITKEQWKDCLAHQVQRKVDVGTQTIMEHIAPSPFHGWNGQEWVLNIDRLKQTKVASLYANLEQTFLAGVDVSTVEGNTSGVTRIKCEPLDLQMWEQGRKEAETKAYVGIVVDFSGCVWKNVESAAYIAMHEAQKRFSEMWWTHFSLLRDMVLTSEDETAIQNITWDTVPM